MLDLCKLLGVEEGEKFKFYGYGDVYFIQKGYLYFIDIDNTEKKSYLNINDVVEKNIIKLPKKKQFTDDELCILRNIDKEYKWIARDKRNTLYVYKENEPFTTGTVWNNHSDNYARFPYDDIFKSISWEDKKPTYIDDYVDR